MSDQILLGVAALVFTLMITGLFLTLRGAGTRVLPFSPRAPVPLRTVARLTRTWLMW